jgi:hypothetical protein
MTRLIDDEVLGAFVVVADAKALAGELTARYGGLVLWVPKAMPPGDIRGSRHQRGRAAGRGDGPS